jgi:cyclophilin family peptidyl-prolyl cis-trans isomerase
MNSKALLVFLTNLVFLSSLFVLPPAQARADLNVESLQEEGDLIVLQITTAPFVINRRYKSMQGPSVMTNIKLKDWYSAGGKIDLAVAPPITGGNIVAQTNLPASTAPTELWWFRGATEEVLQPDSDKPSNPGFMCHFNMDVDSNQRAQELPTDVGFTTRILTLTSGMTDFCLPAGYGVPVSSDENWNLVFQALNHNLDGVHSFRHRVTLYFNRHQGLNVPLKALTWTAPFVAPLLDAADDASDMKSPDCPCCLPPSAGLDAPSNTGRYTLPDGRTATGHWIVPPGIHSWNNPASSFAIGFGQNRKLIAAWVHVHPFAQTMTLRAYDKDDCSKPRDLYTCNITCPKVGVGLSHIDSLSTPEGIPMPASSKYEVTVTYNNTSGKKQDSMAVMGLFMTAPEWRLPEWAMVRQNGNMFCGVKTASMKDANTTVQQTQAQPATTQIPQAATADPAQYALFNQLPSFKGAASPTDKPYRVEMVTSKGTIVFRVEPSWAPKTAAAMKPLFENNLYGGRDFIRVEPGFVIQSPELLPSSLSEKDRSLLYRLPAEIKAGLHHQPGVLSMALWAGHDESATSSFSFLLGNAPHLDGQYTIFAKIENWDAAKSILDAIVAGAANGEKTTIIKTTLLDDQSLVAVSGSN